MLQPKPVAPRAEPTHREAARALLSMLGEPGGTTAPEVPEAQMRRLARDLIAQVEAGPKEEPRPAAPRRRLFSQSAPLAPATAPPPVAPAPVRSEPAASGLPAALAVQAAEAAPTRVAAAMAAPQVRNLVDGAGPLREAEHPAIVALTLRDRAPREQAEALRALPRGQARAVHRALRLLPGLPA